MKIELTFDSFEEMQDFCRKQTGANPSPAPAPDPDPVPWKQTEPEVAEALPAPDPEPEQEPEPELPVHANTYTKVEVRAKLAELKKAGKDVSRLIHSLGYEMFKQVPEDKYPELMAKAGDL